MINREMGFISLQKDLTDNIKEQQAKLGYRKEIVYFYYPLSSLRHFFNEDSTEEEMLEILSDFPTEVTEQFGKIKVSCKKERFCLEIPEKGSEYVHQHVKDNEFIHALVQLVSKPGCTIENVIELFKTYSAEIEVHKMNNGEFDYRISFLNNKENPYYYCFHDEGCQMIYHRFLPEDYADFGF